MLCKEITMHVHKADDNRMSDSFCAYKVAFQRKLCGAFTFYRKLHSATTNLHIFFNFICYSQVSADSASNSFHSYEVCDVKLCILKSYILVGNTWGSFNVNEKVFVN